VIPKSGLRFSDKITLQRHKEIVMAPKRKPLDDETAADPDKNARLETYEQEVERASVESVAEHPDGSAPPLERVVDSHPGKRRK
jgi:hypothetical protein